MFKKHNCLIQLYFQTFIAHYEDEMATEIINLYGKTKRPTNEQLFKAICQKAVPACNKKVEPMSVIRQVSSILIFDYLIIN